MKAFHTIAVPHKDILEGRLTMDVFAADLWEVHNKRGPDEYKDKTEFFKKTYLTEGLKNLLAVVEKRLKGKGGDPVIQVQTPFGGGKTHSLIAMYHKTKEWKAKKCVIVGTALSAKNTLWGVLEKQLTGKITQLKGNSAPGRDALRKLLSRHQPLLILMDEVLEYTTKAAAIKVGESFLSEQTLAFFQELTEAVGTLEKVAVVITLPSSHTEHLGSKAEELFQKLQKFSGRKEKIYTPVQDFEVTRVIRQRLFSRINSTEAKKIIQKYVNYLQKETLLPSGVEPSEYRKRFEESYPFLPEVVDVLYHRWGSFPNFQRTRGVLRLLSLVIYDLKDKKLPYISLADFNLANQEIRRELIKHIGTEYDAVIASDIVNNARKIDATLGDAFKGLKLATRTATAIFMYSFSGKGGTGGVGVGEIKRIATTLDNPANEILEVLEKISDNLFYLQRQSGKYYFTNIPNINHIRKVREENVGEKEIEELEKDLLKGNIESKKLKVFLWPRNSTDIPDTSETKLIILKTNNPDFMRDILESKGGTPRVNRNTLFFLVPMESEKMRFTNTLKKFIAYKNIMDDPTISLSEEQRKSVKNEIKKLEEILPESLREYYRLLYLPDKKGFKGLDLGIPTYGESRKIDREIYEKLRSEGEILESIASLVIKEKYLKENNYALTAKIYESSLKTPGEMRFFNPEVLKDGIKQGVKQGMFGLGELENDTPFCRFFKEDVSVSLSEKEIIIQEKVCLAQKKKEEVPDIIKESEEKSKPETQTEKEEKTKEEVAKIKRVDLSFKIPRGKVADIARIMNLLHQKFESLKIHLQAENGEISKQDYENKIKEAFHQLGIELDE